MFGKKLEDSRTQNDDTVRGKQMKNKDGSQKPGIFRNRKNKKETPTKHPIADMEAKDLPLKDSTKLMMSAVFDDLGTGGKKYADSKRAQVSIIRATFKAALNGAEKRIKEERAEVGKKIDEEHNNPASKIISGAALEKELVTKKKYQSLKSVTDITKVIKFTQDIEKSCVSSPKRSHAASRNDWTKESKVFTDMTIEDAAKLAVKVVDTELPKSLDVISRPFPKNFVNSLVTNRAVNNVIRDNARLYNEMLKNEIQAMIDYVKEIEGLLKQVVK